MNTLQELEQAISILPHNQLLELQNWLNQYSIAQIKTSKQSIHPDLSVITGILPVNLDVQAEYHDYLLANYQQSVLDKAWGAFGQSKSLDELDKELHQLRVENWES